MGPQVMKTQSFELLPTCSPQLSVDFASGDKKES